MRVNGRIVKNIKLFYRITVFSRRSWRNLSIDCQFMNELCLIILLIPLKNHKRLWLHFCMLFYESDTPASRLINWLILAAFNRFISNRFCPQTMFSDDGTNFVCASNEIARLWNFSKRMSGDNVFLFWRCWVDMAICTSWSSYGAPLGSWGQKF